MHPECVVITQLFAGGGGGGIRQTSHPLLLLAKCLGRRADMRGIS